MVDWWVSLQVKEEVVVEAHFSGFLLDKDEKHNYNTHTHTQGSREEQRGQTGAAGAFPGPAMEEVLRHPDVFPTKIPYTHINIDC